MDMHDGMDAGTRHVDKVRAWTQEGVHVHFSAAKPSMTVKQAKIAHN